MMITTTMTIYFEIYPIFDLADSILLEFGIQYTLIFYFNVKLLKVYFFGNYHSVNSLNFNLVSFSDYAFLTCDDFNLLITFKVSFTSNHRNNTII